MDAERENFQKMMVKGEVHNFLKALVSDETIENLKISERFLSAVLKEVTSKITSATSLNTVGLMGNELEMVQDVQLIFPRGRVDIHFFSEGIVFKSKEEVLANTRWGNVLFPFKCSSSPSPNSKNKSQKFYTFVFKDGIIFRKQSIKVIAFQFDNSGVEDHLEEALRGKLITPYSSFKSTKGLPYLNCNYGVNQGFLYPMIEGILFLKPAYFVSSTDIVQLSCGRGGGSTKYVDLILEIKDEKKIEFSNIDREELESLQSFAQKLLQHRTRTLSEPDVVVGLESNGITHEKEGNEDDDEDDENYELAEDSSEGENDKEGESDSSGASTETDSEADEDFEEESELGDCEDEDSSVSIIGQKRSIKGTVTVEVSQKQPSAQSNKKCRLDHDESTP